MIPTVQQVTTEICKTTDDSGDEYLCVFYTGAASEGDESTAASLGFDIVGPNVDQLDLVNLLDRYNAPQYAIRPIRGRPSDKNFYINDSLASLEGDLKERQCSE